LLTGTADTDQKGVTLIGCNDTAELAGVLHGILEQHEVHDGVHFVVLTETLLESRVESLDIGELIVQLLVETTDELGEDEGLGSRTEELLEVELGERLGADLSSELTVLGKVSV